MTTVSGSQALKQGREDSEDGADHLRQARPTHIEREREIRTILYIYVCAYVYINGSEVGSEGGRGRERERERERERGGERGRQREIRRHSSEDT